MHVCVKKEETSVYFILEPEWLVYYKFHEAHKFSYPGEPIIFGIMADLVWEWHLR